MDFLTKTLLFICILFFNCKKEYSCEKCLPDGDKQVNHRPIANAGVDQAIILPTNFAILDGSASTDPENNITSYSWRQVSGPSVFSPEVSPNIVRVRAQSLVAGNYLFELLVTDAEGLFAKDTIGIVVNDLLSISVCEPNRQIVQGSLVRVGNLSQPRTVISVAAVGNKLLFAGGGYPGSSRVDIYDITRNSWAMAELSQARWGISTVTVSNRVYFAGGRYGTGINDTYFSNVDIYDASNNSWSLANLSIPRSHVASASTSKEIIFAGGELGLNTNTDIIDIYDTISRSWFKKTLREPRSNITAVVSRGDVYFAGGTKTQSPITVSDAIDLYNLRFIGYARMLEGRTNFAAIEFENKIFWAGGYSGTTNDITCTLEMVEVLRWNSTIQKLHMPSSWKEGTGQHAVVKDRKILFFRTQGYATNKFDIYDIDSKTWSIGVLSRGLDGASIISVNNTIYIAGGYLDGTLTTSVWKVDF